MTARLRALRRASLVFLFICLFVLSGLSGYPGASFGQAPDSVVALQEITVSALRMGVPASRAPQRITVLGQAEIAATGAHTVADLLAARSALSIRQYGQGLATASFRGGAAGHTQVLIDGMRLSDPSAGQFDLNLLPLHLFDSMEILHGPSSSVYGANGMSSAVYLRSGRSKTARENGQARVLTEIGAWGALRTSAGWSFGKGRISGLVSGEYRQSTGDFPYETDAGHNMRREHSDQEGFSLMGAVQGRAGRHTLRGAFFHVDREQHLPGSTVFGPQEEQQWDTHSRLWLEDKALLGSGTLTLRGFLHRGTLRYLNPHPIWGQDNTARTTTNGLEAAWRTPAGKQLDISAGTSAGYATADNPSLTSDISEFRWAAFLSAAGAYGRWRIYPAVRLDTYSENDRTLSAVSPRFGANVQPVARLPLFVKANVGVGFRPPTFNDRFWTGSGNPDLQPERSYSADAGVQIDGRTAHVEVSAFGGQYSDRIIWTPDEESGVWSPKNLAKTRALGVETSASVQVDKNLTVGALHTWTHATDRSDSASPAWNKRLPFVPAHLLKPYVSATFGRIRIDVHGRFTGRRFTTGAEDKEYSLDPAFVAGAQARFAWSAGPFKGRLSTLLENAFDSQYALVEGYPMPPRHVRLRLVLQTR